MSRPKPTVLLQHSNKTTFKMDEVLAAEGIWAVFYDGKPINLKSSSLVANYPGPKYKKVSFSNPGHAENLAKKLNVDYYIPSPLSSALSTLSEDEKNLGTICIDLGHTTTSVCIFENKNFIFEN